MKIFRSHIKEVWELTQEDIQVAEESGMDVYTGPVSGQAKCYELKTVMEYFLQMEQLTLHKLRKLILLASADERNNPRPTETKKMSNEDFDVADAVKSLIKGEIPDFPDYIAAQKVTSAYKNYADAQSKELDRKIRAGALVDKSEIMAHVNRIANLYEDKFGEAFFREMEKNVHSLEQAIANGNVYNFMRDIVADKLDACVDEVNRLENAVAGHTGGGTIIYNKDKKEGLGEYAIANA